MEQVGGVGEGLDELFERKGALVGDCGREGRKGKGTGMGYLELDFEAGEAAVFGRWWSGRWIHV